MSASRVWTPRFWTPSWGAQLEIWKKGHFLEIAKRASEWRVLNFFWGKMLSSCHFDKMDVCWMFFLLALCWEIVIQNVDTPTCREKRPKLCVLKSTWIIILWNPQWSAKSPTWIWEATDLVKSYSNHIKSCHIISYNIISYHIIYHISYIIFHISYIIYHIQSSILGGGNDDGAHTYKDEPHPGEKQRWLLCFSEPKRSVTATWALTKYLGHLLYTQGIIILLSYIRIMSKNSSNYFRIPYNATWSGLHFFMSAVSNS